jgi:hypothetical protein
LRPPQGFSPPPAYAGRVSPNATIDDLASDQ